MARSIDGALVTLSGAGLFCDISVDTDGAGVAAWVGDATEVIDLDGRLAIPGFIEGHGHYTSFGDALLILDFRYAKSFAEIVSMVAEAAAETPAGEWIVGRGWHQEKWRSIPEPAVSGLPYHDELSAVSPDNPVMLTHASGHAVLVNSVALGLAGIDAALALKPENRPQSIAEWRRWFDGEVAIALGGDAATAVAPALGTRTPPLNAQEGDAALLGSQFGDGHDLGSELACWTVSQRRRRVAASDRLDVAVLQFG